MIIELIWWIEWVECEIIFNESTKIMFKVVEGELIDVVWVSVWIYWLTVKHLNRKDNMYIIDLIYDFD